MSQINKNRFIPSNQSINRLGMVGVTSFVLATNSIDISPKFKVFDTNTQAYCGVYKPSSTRFNIRERYSLDKLISNKKILDNFKTLSPNWNGYDAEPISSNLVAIVSDLISSLDYQPKIFPTGRGSIQIEYHKSNKEYLEIEISEESTFFYSVKGESEEEGDIDINNISELINGFLA